MLAGCATSSPPAASEAPGGSDSGESSELDALIEAAKAEGELIWYQTAAESIGQGVADAFTAEYGIPATFNRLNSSQMEQRFSAEAEAGAPAADVILPLNSAFFANAMEQGWVVPLDEADIPDYPAEHLPEEAILEDEGTVIVGITEYAFAYNTDAVTEEEAPDSWEDLLDPRWDGEILMSDPTISAVYTDLYYLVEEEFGTEYLEELGAEEPRIYQGAAPMGEALAAGEGQLAIPLPVEFIANLQEQTGAPLDWKLPDVSIGATSVLAIVADAPHPNAAKLFAHWLMSEEGLDIFTASAGSINPLDVDEYPTALSGPALAEMSEPRKSEIYAALGF